MEYLRTAPPKLFTTLWGRDSRLETTGLEGSQPFQTCGPINTQTKSTWPTDCKTSPVQKLLRCTCTERVKIQATKDEV